METKNSWSHPGRCSHGITIGTSIELIISSPSLPLAITLG
jgi:hypothetical protein